MRVLSDLLQKITQNLLEKQFKEHCSHVHYWAQLMNLRDTERASAPISWLILHVPAIGQRSGYKSAGLPWVWQEPITQPSLWLLGSASVGSRREELRGELQSCTPLRDVSVLTTRPKAHSSHACSLLWLWLIFPRGNHSELLFKIFSIQEDQWEDAFENPPKSCCHDFHPGHVCFSFNWTLPPLGSHCLDCASSSALSW